MEYKILNLLFGFTIFTLILFIIESCESSNIPVQNQIQCPGASYQDTSDTETLVWVKFLCEFQDSLYHTCVETTIEYVPGTHLFFIDSINNKWIDSEINITSCTPIDYGWAFK